MAEQDRGDSRANESSFSRLPSYPSSPFQRTEIVCEECEQARPNTKSYSVLHIIFLLVFIRVRIDNVVKCQQCMRRFLWQRIFLSVLLANLLCPIILIWWLFLLVRTEPD
jgi:hypothetical protein